MKSVICTMVKDERLDIREWVDYHLSVGFDKIYIYEDFGSVSHNNLLQDLIDKDKVAITALDKDEIPITPRTVMEGNTTQYQLFKWFFTQCKEKKINADWVGFFDIDEFVTFDDGWNLEKLEETFKDYGGVLLRWVMYGANGHLRRPKGKIVDNFTQHMPHSFSYDKDKWCIKSLVNIKKCEGMNTIHIFKDCVCTDFSTNITNREDIYQKCHIRHYFTKSWEDYCFRMQRRGNMKNNGRCYDSFFRLSTEFADKENEMIDYLRFNTTCNGTMWISHRHRIIVGGNENLLKELNTRKNEKATIDRK